MRTNEEILDEIHTLKQHQPNTITRYKIAVNKYCEINNMCLDELIKEAETEEEHGVRWKHRKIKNRLIKFRQYLLNNYMFGTMNQYLTPILVIYKYFEIELQPLPEIAKQSILKTPPITYKDLPDKEIIREALTIASPIMRAIILFMTSSGCAKAETLNLTINDYIEATKEYHNTNSITEVIDTLNKMDSVIPVFNIRRIKTNKYYTTYCSHEAVQAINSYLLSRHDPLILESKLFKISSVSFILNFEKINDELGLGKVNHYKRFRSHMLRKFHATTLYNDGMSLDKVNDLQGKAKNKTDSAYFMTNPENLRQEYINHVNSLTMSKEVEKVTVKSPEFREMEIRNIELQNENTTLKNKVDNIGQRQDNLEKILGNLDIENIVDKVQKEE